MAKLPVGWKCLRCDYTCKSNEAKRLLGHWLKKKGFKVQPCKAVIEEKATEKYTQQLLRITQIATARKRTHEAVLASVDQHQDELVGDLLEARESRKSVSAAARTSDTKSEFVAFCPFLPRAGRPEHEMGDLPRANVVSYLSDNGRSELSLANKFANALVRRNPRVPWVPSYPKVVQFPSRSGSWSVFLLLSALIFLT